MSVGSPAAADVPGIFDVIIDGKGYIFLRTIDTSLPFRTQRAKYTRTPTFLPRTNVSSSFSDNQQDFFFTSSQDAFSLGEGQKFFRQGDTESVQRFWAGKGLDLAIPGQVSLAKDSTATTLSGTPATTAPFGVTVNQRIAYASSSTLYTIDHTGALITHGAHGCAVSAQSEFGMCSDGKSVYIQSSSGGGATTIRRWDGASFSAFSASSNSKYLVFHNNALYGVGTSALYTYSSAGAETLVFTWKNATGSTFSSVFGRPLSYGSKLLIPLNGDHPTVWQYDGTNTNKLIEFPNNFVIYDSCSSNGVAYFSGSFFREGTSAVLTDLRPAVYQWDGSTLALTWVSPTWGTASISAVDVSGLFTSKLPSLCSWSGGILFNDPVRGQIMQYDLASGGVYSIGTGNTNRQTLFASNVMFTLLVDEANTSAQVYPNLSTYVSQAEFYSSLIDFDNSLTKTFRSVKIDFSSATDGDGGAVDVYYQVDSVDGAYTLLQASVTSGTEVNFPAALSGRAIALKIVLRKSSSTAGPVLKRWYLRASPILQSFRSCEYIIDCSGADGRAPVILNDNETAHPKDGLSQATDLQASVVKTTPFSITDRFGTFTGVLKPDETEFIEIAPEEYIVRVSVREV